jgi:hypothetical protein
MKNTCLKSDINTLFELNMLKITFHIADELMLLTLAIQPIIDGCP